MTHFSFCMNMFQNDFVNILKNNNYHTLNFTLAAKIISKLRKHFLIIKCKHVQPLKKKKNDNEYANYMILTLHIHMCFDFVKKSHIISASI